MKPPLQGLRVLVTRPAHQADNLKRLLETQGATAVLFPTLAIVGMTDALPIIQTFNNLDSYQWVIFISANAVNFALQANGGKIPDLKRANIAAVGQATAQALASSGFRVDLLPAQGFNTEALLAMPELQTLDGQRVLIVRGVGGRELLAEGLSARGARIDYLEVYQRVIPDIDNSSVIKLLIENKLDFLTATSAEALQNLLSMLAENHQHLLNLPLIVVSERIKNIAAEMGFKRITVTGQASDTAILDTVTMTVMGNLEWPN